MPDHELLRLNSTWSSLTRGELVSAILSKQSIKSSLEGKRAKYPISWERKKERQSISCRDRRYMYISIYLHHGAFKDMHSRKVRKVGVAIGVCVREREGEERWRIVHFLLAANDWHPKKIMTHERWICSGYGPRKMCIEWILRPSFNCTIEVESSKGRSLFIGGGGGSNKADCSIKSRGHGQRGSSEIRARCRGPSLCMNPISKGYFLVCF